MLNPEIHERRSHSFYFDKRKNVLRKISYCSLCRKGPFAIEDEGKEFVNLTNIKYCISCASLHNFSVPKISKVIKEEIQEEIVEQEWFVFTVRCKDKSLYYGMTQNVETAVKNINRGSGPKSLRTEKKKPVELIESVSAESKQSAMKLKLLLANKK